MCVRAKVSTPQQINRTSATVNDSKTDCNSISVGAESSSPADSHLPLFPPPPAFVLHLLPLPLEGVQGEFPKR